MSGRRAKQLRREAGNPVKPVKVPTPLLERSYIQAPVRYDITKGQMVYRSPKQVRKYLARKGVDVEALSAELGQWLAEYTKLQESVAEAKA